MKRLLIMVIALGCLWCRTSQAQTAAPPLAGEVRAFAVDTSDSQAMAALHHAGWLEASGQVLSAQEFPGAFQMIRRTWTASKVPADKFAIPDLRRLSRSPDDMDRTTAQLLGGDLVTSGRLPHEGASRRLLYCVYMGGDVSQLTTATDSGPQRPR